MPRSMWFYAHDGQTGGPVSVSQLRQMAASGQLLPTDRIRKEDMDRWVKARAVKGLFTATDQPSTAAAEPTGGDTVFDFLGSGPPGAAPEPSVEFHPAFDFFGGPPALPPHGDVPVAAPAPQSTVEDSGSFRLTVPMAAPVESRDGDSVPYAAFQADVPMAMPASDIIDVAPPPVSAELTGPEVMMLPDGTARSTGGVVELSVTGGWLAARSAAPDGSVGETYLRLARLAAVTLRDRPELGMVLSFHAGAEVVAVQCEGDGEAARAFMRRVVDATS